MHRFLLVGLLAAAGCSRVPQIKLVEVPQGAPERANISKTFLVTGIVQVCENPGLDSPGCEYVTKNKSIYIFDVTSYAETVGDAVYDPVKYYKIIYNHGKVGYVLAQALKAGTGATAPVK